MALYRPRQSYKRWGSYSSSTLDFRLHTVSRLRTLQLRVRMLKLPGLSLYSVGRLRYHYSLYLVSRTIRGGHHSGFEGGSTPIGTHSIFSLFPSLSIYSITEIRKFFKFREERGKFDRDKYTQYLYA